MAAQSLAPTEYDVEMMKFTNLIRTDPKSFIPDLKNMLNKFNGLKRTVLTKKGSSVQSTKEGSKPVEELISFLE